MRKSPSTHSVQVSTSVTVGLDVDQGKSSVASSPNLKDNESSDYHASSSALEAMRKELYLENRHFSNRDFMLSVGKIRIAISPINVYQ